MTRRIPSLVFSLALVCVAAPNAAAETVSLACRGRVLSYTPDYSVQLGTLEPFDFGVVFDLSRGRLLSAPVRDALEFEVRESWDAVFFFRDALIAGRKASEWISINRIAGRYAHFIAPIDPRSGGLGSPVLITSADCKRAADPSASRTPDAFNLIGLASPQRSAHCASDGGSLIRKLLVAA